MGLKYTEGFRAFGLSLHPIEQNCRVCRPLTKNPLEQPLRNIGISCRFSLLINMQLVIQL